MGDSMDGRQYWQGELPVGLVIANWQLNWSLVIADWPL
jgi:hypothetical protein